MGKDDPEESLQFAAQEARMGGRLWEKHNGLGWVN